MNQNNKQQSEAREQRATGEAINGQKVLQISSANSSTSFIKPYTNRACEEAYLFSICKIHAPKAAELRPQGTTLRDALEALLKEFCLLTNTKKRMANLLQSKKGLWEGGRSIASLSVGIILLILGFIPLLKSWGAIPFGLPAFLGSFLALIATYLIAAGGFYLLIDGFLQWGNPFAWVTFVVALIVLGIGLVPILHSFGVLGFTIPFFTETFYSIIFTVEGIFLFIGAFIME